VQGGESQSDAPDDVAGVDEAIEPGTTTPVEILETRVHHANADLRRRSLHLLSRLVASKAAGREVLLSAEALLDEVRRLRGGGGEPAELEQLEQKLEEHLELARRAQSR
ncbi:MAG TPA: hypothetical protein VFP52_12810, partial [Myxococcales bacterium]|nr:hypothetical protein [Myxococcales bacterium]